MGFSKSLLLAFAASTYLTQTTLARDDDDCSPVIKEIRERKFFFNSTKTTDFTPSPGLPWVFTLGLSDWRKEGVKWAGPEGDTVQHIESFLSIPNDIAKSSRANETRVCVYMLKGQNATADDGDESGHSCNGIVSDECQKALRSIKGPTDEGRCPDPSESVKKACNQYLEPAFGRAQVYNNTNCSTATLPGIGLPGGYRTFPLAATSLFPSDSPTDSYKQYSLRMRQPIPFLLNMEFYNETLRTATELLCVAPNELAKDSREPEGDFPPSAAAGLDIKGAVVLAVGVWSVMALLFV